MMTMVNVGVIVLLLIFAKIGFHFSACRNYRKYLISKYYIYDAERSAAFLRMGTVVFLSFDLIRNPVITRWLVHLLSFSKDTAEGERTE